MIFSAQSSVPSATDAGDPDNQKSDGSSNVLLIKQDDSYIDVFHVAKIEFSFLCRLASPPPRHLLTTHLLLHHYP